MVNYLSPIGVQPSHDVNLLEDYFADVVRIYQEEINDLYDLGCRESNFVHTHVEINSPNDRSTTQATYRLTSRTWPSFATSLCIEVCESRELTRMHGWIGTFAS